MKIALCQMDIEWLDCKANLSKIKGFLHEAEKQQARIIVFPEMALTGFCMDTAAATVTVDSPVIRELVQMTQGMQILMMIGVALKQGLKNTNSFLLIRNGEILTEYSKINLFTITNEHQCYDPGQELLVVEYDGLKIAPLICFDMRFGRLFSQAVGKGAEVFIGMASWPAAAAEQWKTLLCARAIDTQAYVLGVNRIGNGDGVDYAGYSTAFSPGGKCLIDFCSDEKLMFVEIDGSYVRKLRERFPALVEQHLRPRDYDVRTLTLR